MQNETIEQTVYETVDVGLRSYMQKIYGYMAAGLCLTALSAWIVANTSLLGLFFNFSPEGYVSMSAFGWIAFIAPLIMVFAFGWVVNRGTLAQTQMLFWAYAAVMGISLTPVCLIYTGSSLTRVFLITAGAFGGLSLYGYTTKRNLSALGSFLYMGLIGLIIAMIVNIFLKSSGLDWVLSILGVGIFSGLTAYDTQVLRLMYHPADSNEIASKKAISGALQLYLDFINLFLYLLRFMGDRR